MDRSAADLALDRRVQGRRLQGLRPLGVLRTVTTSSREATTPIVEEMRSSSATGLASTKTPRT